MADNSHSQDLNAQKGHVNDKGPSEKKDISDEPLLGDFPQWGFAVIACIAFLCLIVAISIYCVVRHRKHKKHLEEEEKLRQLIKDQKMKALVQQLANLEESRKRAVSLADEENEQEISLKMAKSATFDEKSKIRSPSLHTASSMTKKKSKSQRHSPANDLFSQDQRLRTLGPQAMYGRMYGSKTVTTSIISTEPPTRKMKKSRKSKDSSSLPNTSKEDIDDKRLIVSVPKTSTDDMSYERTTVSVSDNELRMV